MLSASEPKESVLSSAMISYPELLDHVAATHAAFGVRFWHTWNGRVLESIGAGRKATWTVFGTTGLLVENEITEIKSALSILRISTDLVEVVGFIMRWKFEYALEIRSEHVLMAMTLDNPKLSVLNAANGLTEAWFKSHVSNSLRLTMIPAFILSSGATVILDGYSLPDLPREAWSATPLGAWELFAASAMVDKPKIESLMSCLLSAVDVEIKPVSVADSIFVTYYKFVASAFGRQPWMPRAVKGSNGALG